MMTASRDSVAYQRYDERFLAASRPQAPAPHNTAPEQPAPRRHRRPRAQLGTSACVCVIVLAVVYMLVCEMRLTSLTAQVTAQTNSLDELTAESISLSSKQSYNLDLAEVEAYAVENLGMVKMDSSQIEYIELVEPDTVTVAESGISLDALFAGLVRSFSAVVEYIS